jgi:uroporphyrinogen-III synthase
VSAPARIVIVTRPGVAGAALTHDLRRAGIAAEHWPAFEIGAAPNLDALDAALAQLETFDCVVFVSPAAVRAVANRRLDLASRSGNAPHAWPSSAAVAVVGATTAEFARSLLGLPDAAVLIAPDGDAAEDSGSEALWPKLQALAPRRVLIARAQHGRDWLVNQLASIGVAVTTLAVYSRLPRPLSATQKDQVQRWFAEGREIVTVFSSSEAIDVVIGSHDVATEVLRSGTAIATHPRIEEALRAQGVAQATTVRSEEVLVYLKQRT